MKADHLIDGGAHPAEIVMPLLDDMETGAVRSADLPPRVGELIRIARVELAKRRKWEMDERAALARVRPDGAE